VTIPTGKPTPRVDSFELIEVDCTPMLTDEQKKWPVAALRIRVDSHDVIEVDASPKEMSSDVSLRVTVTSGATPDDLALVVQKLRAAVEDARTATGGRVVIRIDSPSDAA
jgi:hypothetical protein